MKTCTECGNKSLSWATSVRIVKDVQQGRLNTSDVECYFTLGCDDCSETLTCLSADEVADILNLFEVRS